MEDIRNRVIIKQKNSKKGWYFSNEFFSSAEERYEFISSDNKTMETLYINPYTINDHIEIFPMHYRKIQFDPVWKCNFNCSYCNAKPENINNVTIDQEHLLYFLKKCILSTNRFNLGCGMEPLLYDNVEDVAIKIREHVNIRGIYGLQTNGSLLDRVDIGKLKQSRINLLSLSIDTINPKIAHFVRNGINVGKIFRSAARILDRCPDMHFRIVCTVTRQSLDYVEDMIEFCHFFGAEIFTLRHVVPPKDKKHFTVNGKKYPSKILEVPEKEFLILSEKILDTFGEKVEIEIICHQSIAAHSKNTNKGNWKVKTW